MFNHEDLECTQSKENLNTQEWKITQKNGMSRQGESPVRQNIVSGKLLFFIKSFIKSFQTICHDG